MGTTEGGQGSSRELVPAQGWKGGGVVVSRSPKVSVRCIGPVFTEDKRARGSPGGGGGPSLVGRGLKLEGGVGKGPGSEEGEGLSVHYIERYRVCTCLPGTRCPPLAVPARCLPPRGVYL